jgi:5-methylcytosine-specific restriction enzyme B
MDVRLLDHLRESIIVAHERNPSSWSFNQIHTGALVLFVEQFWVLSVREEGGDIRFVQTSGKIGVESATTFPLDSQEDTPSGIEIRGLSIEELHNTYTEYRLAHHELVRNRAGVVRTRAQRANEHNPELVDMLAQVLGKSIPQPDYDLKPVEPGQSASKKYRSRTASITGYWKSTIGDDTWQRYQDRGEMEVEIPETPSEDLSAWPDDRSAFARKAKQSDGISDGWAHRIWMFVKGMQVGDSIIVHSAPSPILGIGEIASDYQFNDNRHIRRVSWTNTESVPLDSRLMDEATKGRNLWGLTPIDRQGFDLLARAVGVQMGDMTGDDAGRSLSLAFDAQTLANHFQQSGLTYTPVQIATFYTSLQTKGFVVLSGISGTGKSKIAQGFVDLLPGAEIADGNRTGRVAANMLSFMMSTSQNWAAISANQSDLFPPIDENIRQPAIFDYSGNLSKGYVVLRTLNQGKPTLYLTLGRELSDALREIGTDRRFYAVFELDDAARSVERVRIHDRPVFIDAEKDEDPDPGTVGASAETNSLFLAVRPDWRDSTSLLGYYNPLTETYEWTDFLRFILRAAESYRKKDGLAWFVILDEMNLAHVEYYFADLLSIIESGRDNDGWSREPIRLTYPDAKTDNPPPHEIYLPPNLYVIGTVNMDETTHAFSPKVLDRAFTIELTDVDFTHYPPAPAESGAELTDDERTALLDAFTRHGTFAQVSKDDIRKAVDAHPEMRRWLQNLNTRLAKDQFHFGYRVFDEIAQFIHNADENKMFVRDGIDESLAWQEAFDHAVYMKVLPKFNGSHARLIGPLNSLLDWARNPDAPMDGLSAAERASMEDVGEDAAPSAPAPKLDRVAKRVEAMITTLEANGFVSFG